MSADRVIHVLVIDDELLARQHLERLLEGYPDVEVIGSIDNGLDAVDAIRDLDPDIVFLDVQMPGLSGLEVARRIGPTRMPVVIFVTAYQQHALEAFEVTALDYLLKPFDDDRFHDSFARARNVASVRDLQRLREQLAVLVSDNAPHVSAPTGKPKYLQRIAVELRGQIKVIPVDSVDFISASGPYAEIQAGEDMYIIREQMQSLEGQLDPDQFFRIHRSTIVRLARIESMFARAGSRYAVRLEGGKHLRVSRTRWDELSRRLGTQPL